MRHASELAVVFHLISLSMLGKAFLVDALPSGSGSNNSPDDEDIEPRIATPQPEPSDCSVKSFDNLKDRMHCLSE